ncbi:MAG: DnaD domain protein [Lachnospiraceae bacterium]|nr:DnaD domain protein [Lachnospiraceae bacterium]
MNSLTIYKDDYAGSTAISNRFIDNFMADANDAQIKVYLYLVRMMSANLPTGISDMADKFNHTEKDIMRALKYWERNHLLALEYNEAKVLTGIRFISPAEVPVNIERPLAPIVPLKLVPTPAEQKAPEVTVAVTETEPETAKPDYDNFTCSRDQLKAFKDSPETGQLLFVAESYLNRTLSLKDIETLYFISDELKFSEDLVDHLLQYCIGKGKTSFSYIKKVAISWAEAGIKTPKEAKAFIGNNYDKNVYTILKSLGRTSTPTPKEAEMVTKWYKDYGFDLEIINEACGRTVLATDSHRLEYCEKILSSWKNAGVKTLSDVAGADSTYRKPKAPAASSSSKNQFNQMIRTKYDFDEIERQILSN